MTSRPSSRLDERCCGRAFKRSIVSSAMFKVPISADTHIFRLPALDLYKGGRTCARRVVKTPGGKPSLPSPLTADLASTSVTATFYVSLPRSFSPSTPCLARVGHCQVPWRVRTREPPSRDEGIDQCSPFVVVVLEFGYGLCSSKPYLPSI